MAELDEDKVDNASWELLRLKFELEAKLGMPVVSVEYDPSSEQGYVIVRLSERTLSRARFGKEFPDEILDHKLKYVKPGFSRRPS